MTKQLQLERFKRLCERMKFIINNFNYLNLDCFLEFSNVIDYYYEKVLISKFDNDRFKIN